MISNYFKNNQLNNYDRANFKLKNNIKINKLVLNDKTICQMLKNINLILNYKYENLITDIIKYTIDSVLKLREYKKDFDNDWWKDSKNNKIRSSFFEFKKNIVKNKRLLNIEHFIFVKLKTLYENNKNIQDYILEITYYLYKINIKLLEYENIKIINDHVFNDYNKYWNKIIKKFDVYNNDKFDIFFSKEIPINDNKKINIFYNDNIITLKATYKNINKYFNLSRNYVENEILKNEYDCIIEFGSGWGRNIFHYCNKLQEKLDNIHLIGGEYTKSGLLCANKIKDKYFNNKKINFYHFDYNNPELFFEQISLINNFKNVLCISFHSIEQITNIKILFFELLLNNLNNIKFIHHEPIGWQINNSKSFMKENKTGFRKYYNKNLYKTIKNLEKNKKIKINNEIINYFNFGPKESIGSLIEWSKI